MMSPASALSISLLLLIHPSPSSLSVEAFSAQPLTKYAVQTACSYSCKYQTKSSPIILFSIGGRGGGGRVVRGKERILNKFGHIYTQIGGSTDQSICKIDGDDIHKLIRDRMHCRDRRDFQQADEILKELAQNGVHVNDRMREWRADGTNSFSTFFRFSDCQTIEEAAQLAFDHKSTLSHSNMSAFWTSTSRLLPNSPRVGGQPNQLQSQLESIFSQTMDNVDMYEMKDLTQTNLAFAKIVNNVGRGGKKYAKGSPQEILHGILVKQKQVVFRSTANAAYPQLSRFDGRRLSNLAYANALVGVVL